MMISVILPAYNAQQYLREAVDSILNQTYKDFELIVIDDGSKDSTSEIIESYKDPRIRLEKNDGNKGLIYSLNRGLSLAEGKYIARMDADDISMPNRFEEQVRYMEGHTDCIVCGTEIMPFKNGMDLWFLGRRYKYDDFHIKNQLLMTACFAHPTVMIRSDVLKKSGLQYDINYKHAEDYKLWIDFSQYGKYHNLKNRLLKYRITPTQVTSSPENKKIIAEALGRCKNEYLQRMFADRPEIVELMHEDKYTSETIKKLKKNSLPKDVLCYLMYNVYTSFKFDYSKKDLRYYLISLDCMKFDVLSTRYILRRFKAAMNGVL